MSTAAWRRLLKPLVPVYAAALQAKEWLLSHEWLRQHRLAHPVISVGSLSAGGAGKTPVVMMLAELLIGRGYEVRILTRGYGRAGNAPELVLSSGDSRRFGDEPLMMARRLPAASVWVGADRYRTGRLTERNDAQGARVVYLLDDGFQHRKLVRDIDVVLLTRQELTDNLLPLGNLREPLQAMQRADLVVMREEEGFAAGLSGRAATWFVRRSLRFDPDQTSAHSRSKRTIAFCGLARPEGFFAMLADAGVEVAAVSIFRDHHTYGEADVWELLELARTHDADGFVTTEKDAVKLTPAMRLRLGRLLVAELRMELREPETSIDSLLALIASKRLS